MNTINDLDISLLGFISSRPLHGYELHKMVADLTGYGIVWNIKIGKLYSMLNKLEKQGLITSTCEKEGNRPTRNEFSVTKKGINIFQQWLRTPINHGRDFRMVFLLKLFFLLGNETVKANELISSQIIECKNWLNEILNQSKSNHDMAETDIFQMIVKEYRQIQIKGFITWLEWCKESLKERA
jgi:PadR family transcriptional regulator, regulatory protein AphA